MDFETALTFFSEGETLARGSWTSEHQNISLIGENKNFFLSSADIKADDWFIFKASPGYVEMIKDGVSFYMAMEYLTAGYKIRRSNWDLKYYLFDGEMYRGSGVCVEESDDVLSLEDVTGMDWSVYK